MCADWGRWWRCTGHGSGFEPLPPCDVFAQTAQRAGAEYAQQAVGHGLGAGELLVAVTPVVQGITCGAPMRFRFDCVLIPQARLIPEPPTTEARAAE